MQKFTEKDLEKWLRYGEGPQIDFKHAISNLPKIAKSIAAFANSKGGYLIIGIDDNKDILGTEIEAEKYQLNKATQNYCRPLVALDHHVLNYKGANLLIADIPESTSKPHFVLDKRGTEKLYIRVQDNCVIADDLFQQHLLSGSLNNAMQNSFMHQQIQQQITSLFQKNDSMDIQSYVEQSGLDHQQATRRLLDMVLSGVLTKEENKPVFRLSERQGLKIA